MPRCSTVTIPWLFLPSAWTSLLLLLLIHFTNWGPVVSQRPVIQPHEQQQQQQQQHQQQLDTNNNQQQQHSSATTVMEQIWKRLQQHVHTQTTVDQSSMIQQLQQQIQQQMQQQQQQAPNQQQQHRSTSLTAPHVYTRGGPSVATRRRALYEHSIYSHYSQQLTAALLQQQQQQSEQQQQQSEQDNELSGEATATASETTDTETTDDNNSMDTSNDDETAHGIRSTLQTVFSTFLYEPRQQLQKQQQHHLHLLADGDRHTSYHTAWPPLPASKRRANLETIRDMFTHAYDSYMTHAWPAPELRPISCQAGTFDLIPLQGLTLIDSLDTLLVMGNATEFARALERLRLQHSHQHLWHVDENVSLFEITIRVLGGLLSAHQLATAFIRNPATADASSSESDNNNKNNNNKVWVRQSDVFTDTGQIRWGYSDQDDHDDTSHHQQQQEPESTTDENDGFCMTAPTLDNYVMVLQHDPCEDNDSALLFVKGQPTCRRGNSIVPPTAANTCTATRKPLNQTATDHAPQQRHASSNGPYWIYDGFLLDLARDLGERLLPAFTNTRTGIPYGTVNLRHGVPRGETTVASLAGGGTLSLEFELLSRLTGDDRFGKAAKLASRALWLRRSQHQAAQHPTTTSSFSSNLNLFGKHIDIQKGQWTETLSGIGSNSDSFLEYLVKQYMLFPEDDDFWIMLLAAYSGVYEHSRLGEWYVDTEMNVGARAGRSRHVLESLMAFYPGMQVLLGEVTPAARSLNSFFMVRELLGFLPERFNFGVWNVDASGAHASLHPLRPELLESCYFLHRATAGIKTSRTSTRQGNKNDPTNTTVPPINNGDGGTSGWLWAADFALHKLETVTRTTCGYATVLDVKPRTTGTVDGSVKSDKIPLHDEMPSFFLSETLKYLYLTFDDDNILHRDDQREWIFTTEAHPIHYVPPTDNSNNKKQQLNDANQGTTRVFQQEVQVLKSLIRGRLEQETEKSTHADDPIISSYNWDSSKRVPQDLWSHETSLDAYRRGIVIARASMAQSRNNERERHSADNFFQERQVVDSFLHSFQERNTAYQALKDTGVGSGRLLRKACPNVYASDLLWMHALNGGATDYSAVYVSVMTDDKADHPISFLALGAADALEILGSGLYPVVGQELNGHETTCPVFDTTGGGDSVHEDTRHEKNEHDHVPASEKQSDDDGGLLEGADSLDASDFLVATFKDGGGIVVEHVPSSDKVIATFANDEADQKKNYMLIYAGYTIGDAPPKNAPTNPATIWRMAGSRRKQSTDGSHSFHRKVIMADFEGNSFSCEIKLFRLEIDADVERENLLLTLPCAPGMFGQTHVAELVEMDSFSTDAVIVAPPSGDYMGCPIGAHDTSSSDSIADITVDSAQIVYRGDCTFYAKAAHMKTSRGAKVVIVVNTEDDELFVMSQGSPEEDNADLEDLRDLPITVLITGLDGEDLLSIVNNEEASGGQHVTARITMKRQIVTTVKNKVVIEGDGQHRWPGVVGSSKSLQVFAKGGWGLQALQHENLQGWDMQLFTYQEP